MRWLLLALGYVVLFASNGKAALVQSTKLDIAQITQLYEESCLDRPFPYENEFGIGVLACTPRDYPWKPVLSGTRCSFYFWKAEDGGFSIYYGRFTASRPQAIIMYQGACEPNVLANGGMALFDVVDGNFRLIRYYPGHYYTGCVVVPADKESKDKLFCMDWSIAQGSVGENIGPIRFNTDGSATFDSWYEAGNLDGMLGAVTTCDGETKAHHFLEMSFDQKAAQIVVEAAMRPPRLIAEACRRYFAQEFDEEDKERRRENPFREEFGLIRSDEENTFVKVFIRFDPKRSTPQIEITDERVPVVSP